MEYRLEERAKYPELANMGLKFIKQFSKSFLCNKAFSVLRVTDIKIEK